MEYQSFIFGFVSAFGLIGLESFIRKPKKRSPKVIQEYVRERKPFERSKGVPVGGKRKPTAKTDEELARMESESGTWMREPRLPG